MSLSSKSPASKSPATKSLERFSLAGKTVLVTGGMGLIGGELCRVLADAGAALAMLDNHPETESGNARQRLRLRESTDLAAVRADIADPDSVDRAVDRVLTAYGRIDVLINCAAIDAKFDKSDGAATSAALHDMPFELWRRSVDVNVTGLFAVTRRVLQHMLERGTGNVVNVASVYSLVSPDQKLYGDPNSPGFRPKPVDYVATKSMVPNFTRYVATTYGRHGIRCNCVVPHGIETDHSSDFKRRFADRSPLGRMCRLEEIGPPVLLLASDASSYMTGSTLVVDGGWTAW